MGKSKHNRDHRGADRSRGYGLPEWHCALAIPLVGCNFFPFSIRGGAPLHGEA